ncbi:MAG: tetratricopeptide (TPR) repeat protein [Saprospiraceae bacterium]|jgi:tetratricopeptide (TPR) repeat protein
MTKFCFSFFRRGNLCCIVASLIFCVESNAQIVGVSEEMITLKTYEFGDPNPISILSDNPTIYPYFKYDGYSQKSEEKKWKVVTLENEFIKVMILPEAGGKVWGAIDKTTGEEFIYKNEVMKFRNISMRGPWTSGGIEFNFGVIGHHPSTASPVDYAYGNEPDGSAYCIVGAIDLPSRTQWRVKIVLKKGRANFETQASWYNPTTFRHAYYNWMTAAAPATEDLVIYAPGDEYLDHGGDPHPYPIDAQGRNLSKYSQNNFGPSKSYHVVGSYDDYFGGYFEEKDYGFGHWSTYDDSPGQKVWLWDLSRSGGIWENLLTDTDGQYIEFQAGRLLNQYSPETKKINPTSKRSFSAGTHDQWREVWFPINGIGGITDASERAVMHILKEKDNLTLGINSFMDTSATVHKTYTSGRSSIEPIVLQAMQNVQLEITGDIESIKIPELELGWELPTDSKLIDRVFSSTITDSMRHSSNEYIFYLAEQAYVARHYESAEKLYLKCIDRDPLHLGGLASLGELYLKEAKYDKAKKYLKRALEIDTYHPRSNYLLGILFKIKEEDVDALESLSWATRDISYQSIAYSAMAEILIRLGKYKGAIDYCNKSLETNSRNMHSLFLLKTAERLIGNGKIKSTRWADLLELDELHDGAQIEEILANNGVLGASQFSEIFKGEFADQALLECVLYYHLLGRKEEALKVAKLMSNPNVMVSLWIAYLENNPADLRSIEKRNVDFVMPHRAESLEILDWAISNSSSWKFKYYKSLVLIGLRQERGYELLSELDKEPNAGLFYLNRSQLLKERKGYKPISDLEIANNTSEEWRIDHLRSEYYTGANNYEKALSAATESLVKDPGNYILKMDVIRALLYMDKYTEAISQMKNISVLPFEGASSGRVLYEVAHTGNALDLMKSQEYNKAIKELEKAKTWDESMGVGEPFDADNRLQDYLLSHCFTKMNNPQESKSALGRVIQYSVDHPKSTDDRRTIGIKALMDGGHTAELEGLKRQGEDWNSILEELNKKSTNLLTSTIIEALKLY